MAIPTFAGVLKTDFATASSACSPPSNTASGDVLLAFAVMDNNTDAVSTPGSGYTHVLTQNGGGGTPDERLSLYYKVLTGAEGDTTWTFSEVRNHSIVICRITGADGTTPVADSAGAGATGDVAGTSWPVPTGVVTTAADQLIVAAIAFDQSAGPAPPQCTPPSSHGGWTEQLDDRNTASNCFIGIASVGIASASTTVTGSWTIGVSDRTAQIMVAIASGGGGITVNLGLVTGTNTSQAVARLKSRAVNQASSTNTAQATGRVKSKLVRRARRL